MKPPIIMPAAGGASAEHPDRSVVNMVLQGAIHRFEAGGVRPKMDGCVCDLRSDNDPSAGIPYPDPGAGPWCFLCAVEGAQVTLKAHGDYFSYALAAVAEQVSGQTYGLFQPGERDEVLFPWSEGSSAEEIVQTFRDAAA